MPPSMRQNPILLFLDQEISEIYRVSETWRPRASGLCLPALHSFNQMLVGLGRLLKKPACGTEGGNGKTERLDGMRKEDVHLQAKNFTSRFDR